MIEELEDGDLLLEALHVLDLLLGHFLDCSDLPRLLVLHSAYNSVGARAQRLLIYLVHVLNFELILHDHR